MGTGRRRGAEPRRVRDTHSAGLEATGLRHVCGAADGRFARRLAALAIVILIAGAGAAAASGFIRAEGTRLVDAEGQRFTVKGINLGNWLVPEGYMFKFMRARAPAEISGVSKHSSAPKRRPASGPNSATNISPRTTSASSRPQVSIQYAFRCIGGSSSSPARTKHGSRDRDGPCSIGWSNGAGNPDCG